MILHSILVPPERGQLQDPAPFWDTLEGKLCREVFPEGRVIRVHQVFHFAWLGKWPDMKLYTDTGPVANGWAAWLGTLKEHN